MSARRMAARGGKREHDRLAGLAAQINADHQKVIDGFRTAISAAWEIGGNLSKAKALVPRGDWPAWVEKNCKCGLRMAQRYKRLRDSFPSKTTLPSFLTIEDALQSIAKPRAVTVEGHDSTAPAIEAEYAVDDDEQPDAEIAGAIPELLEVVAAGKMVDTAARSLAAQPPEVQRAALAEMHPAALSDAPKRTKKHLFIKADEASRILKALDVVAAINLNDKELARTLCPDHDVYDVMKRLKVLRGNAEGLLGLIDSKKTKY